ncbi:MAG: MBOAT family protein [Bacteroidota bacterium]
MSWTYSIELQTEQKWDFSGRVASTCPHWSLAEFPVSLRQLLPLPMVFSSATFLFYFLPVFLLLYLLAPTRFKNWVALLGSLAFYTWGAPNFVLILLGAIGVDFFLAKWMGKESRPKRKKQILACSLVLNVGLLAYFKYANFFVDNLNQILQSWGVNSVEWVAVALPIGISFFTFQKISYVLDVYRGTHAPLTSLRDYALYILLFPQLIAGPIVRYHEVADQLLERKSQLSAPFALAGMFRFVIGLSKKMLIANPLGKTVDIVFAGDLSQLGTGTAWIILIAYAFQIYYDFSGYSDMAIGLGQMMGFRFPENFRFPYTSRSITEFWRRWHITLSQWMRDYLYIPLGGNRHSASRTYLNLWIVFLISGLWHGAAWNFLIWGIWHGSFLVLERLFLGKILKRIGALPSLIYAFLVVLIGWVWFRVESLGDGWLYLQQLAGADGGTERWFHPYYRFNLILAAAFAFLPALFQWEKRLESWLETSTRPLAIWGKALLAAGLLLLCFSEIATASFNPFIYFRF